MKQKTLKVLKTFRVSVYPPLLQCFSTQNQPLNVGFGYNNDGFGFLD
jgi:hypothetical protein